MTQYDRIKHLRKTLLKLTQSDFAARINISRSNFGNIECGSVVITDRVLSDICRAFSVRRAWLVDGAGEIFENGQSAELIELIRLYENLTEPNRKYLHGYIQRLLEEQGAEKKKSLEP